MCVSQPVLGSVAVCMLIMSRLVWLHGVGSAAVRNRSAAADRVECSNVQLLQLSSSGLLLPQILTNHDFGVGGKT